MEVTEVQDSKPGKPKSHEDQISKYDTNISRIRHLSIEVCWNYYPDIGHSLIINYTPTVSQIGNISEVYQKCIFVKDRLCSVYGTRTRGKYSKVWAFDYIDHVFWII